MKQKQNPYNSSDHTLTVIETHHVDQAVWCCKCNSGFGLSKNGVRTNTADEHEKLIGEPHTWYLRDQNGQKISNELQTCGHNYELATWEYDTHHRACSCGEPTQQQYDQLGVYCGYMCDTKFKNTYPSHQPPEKKAVVIDLNPTEAHQPVLQHMSGATNKTEASQGLIPEQCNYTSSGN